LLTQLVPQTSGELAPQLGRQLAGWLWREQSGVVPLQTSEQLPQCVGRVRSASQPSSGLVEQWPLSVAQALAGMKQTPERHSMPVAPGLRPGRVVQSWLHEPQLVGSEATLTHLVPHRSGDGAAQLDEQLGALALIEQRPVGLLQSFPHCPQFAGVVSGVSQPSSARVEQCPYPDAQALAGTKQAPLRHSMPEAFGLRLGRAVQSWPQVPQFRGSVVTFTQEDTQRSGAGAAQLAAHFGAPLALLHKAIAPLHLTPQVPQVAGSVRLASQPSSGRAEQCA